jgi:hypothetical protein
MTTTEVTDIALVLLEKGAIKSDQDGIRVSLKDLDKRIHMNAVQCLLHAEKHGDTSLMRRLLVDIIDAKSGYRRQGIIAWMKEFSPMRLNIDVIKLDGMKDGQRQPFRCDLAAQTPFTELASARELVPIRPIFRDGLTSKIERAIKEYKDAVANTEIVPGFGPRAKTAGKPFYNGNRMDQIEASFDKLTTIVQEITSWNDPTKDLYSAQQALAKAKLEEALANEELREEQPQTSQEEPVPAEDKKPAKA